MEVKGLSVDPQGIEFKNKNTRKDGLLEIGAILETDMVVVV
jgi:hypothetical protein